MAPSMADKGQLLVNRRGAVALATAATASSPLMPPSSAVAAAQTPMMPALRLSDGSPLPLATFGIQIYDDATAYACTTRALQAGFRSFFTSPEAGNQRGFARAIHDSQIAREQLFIAGSVLSDEASSFRKGEELTARACDASFEDLAFGGVDGLDLLMLERPAVAGGDAIRGQWRALEQRRASGSARSLGTCNFDVSQLDCILRGSRGRGRRPATLSSAPVVVNQIGFNLATRMPHAAIRQAHAERGVALQAWGPLGGPSALIPRAILDECAALGKPRGKSASQVALRWLAQQNVAFVVHSRSLGHLRDDLAIFDAASALSEAEMRRLERDSESAPAYY
jgi:2,5-diketo-D-gluconate reductase A